MGITQNREIQIANTLAQQAGDLAMRFRRSGLQVEYKQETEPVTEADRAASGLIVAGLLKAFPDDIIISEEAPDNLLRLTAHRVWYVDPIDGTNDYIHNRDGFTVMIGLAIDQKPFLGTVYQPTAQRIFYAAQGLGAWMRCGEQPAQRLHCSQIDALSNARLVASRSHRTTRMDQIKERLGINSEYNVGSVGLKLGLLALAERDLYVNPAPMCKTWDTCAPEAILQEAGGKVTDLRGAPLRYDQQDSLRRSGILASNGILHDQAIEKLAALFPTVAPLEK